MTGNGHIELFKVTSYNFQLIGQKLVLWAPPAGGGDKVSQKCNRCESPDWSLFPREPAVMPYLVLLA